MSKVMVYVFIVIACLALGNLIWDSIAFLINKIREKYLISHLNSGSETYMLVKSKIEECIKSGEINNYFEGFQLSRVDPKDDSETMKDLQLHVKSLTKNEKFKIQYYSKKLLDNIDDNKE